MNDLQMRYVKDQLEKNKGINAELTFEKLKTIAKKHSLNVTVRATKKDVVETIFKSKYIDEFMNEYQKLFTVPDFHIKKVYQLKGIKQVHQLEALGVIPTGQEQQIISERKGNFHCRVYPLEVLAIDAQEILEQEKLLDRKEMKLRIELQDINNIEVIEKHLKTFLEIDQGVNVFKNKDGSYYCYYSANLKLEEKQNENKG